MKVYLCKSNRCDPVLVSAARRYLQGKGNIEVIEHTGGTYNPNLIKSAKEIVVVPEPEANVNTKFFVVGKGQYTEIGENLEKAIVFLSKDYMHIGFSKVSDIELFDKNSWVSCARIYINENRSECDKANIDPGMPGDIGGPAEIQML